MVEVVLVDVLVAIVLILVFLMMIESRYKLNNKSLDMDDRLDIIEDSLKVVAAVLQQIPDMVPRFELQNNPLSQILEFIQSMRNESEASISAPRLRDDTGRFSDGETETKED